MTFLEVGPGSGDLTQLLLESGMTGSVYELSRTTCEGLTIRFSDSIRQGHLIVRNESFLTSLNQTQKFDFVIAAMVLEHLDSFEERAFIQKCEDFLKTNGVLMLFVPAELSYWGIEDEVAGHFRRYTRQSLTNLLAPFKFSIESIRGLTFPLSNMLLTLSNFLVRRSETPNLQLEIKERTLLSGHRDVMFKTVFPKSFCLILNKFTLYPFYLMQNLFKNSPKSLVIFMKARKLN